MLIKYIKSVLWRVAKCLSYIEEARCLKVKHAVLKVSWLLILCIIWQNVVDVCWYPRIDDLAEFLNGRNSVCISAAAVYWCRANTPKNYW